MIVEENDAEANYYTVECDAEANYYIRLNVTVTHTLSLEASGKQIIGIDNELISYDAISGAISRDLDEMDKVNNLELVIGILQNGIRSCSKQTQKGGL